MMKRIFARLLAVFVAPSIFCLAHVPSASPALAQQGAGDEIERFFGPDAATADAAVEARIAALWKTLLIGEARDRLAARLDLVEIGAPARRRLLAETTAETAEARRQAIMTLGRLGGRGVLERLRDLLRSQGAKLDDPTLQALILAIGRLGDAGDAAAVERRFLDTRNRRTRRVAVYAIARLTAGTGSHDLTRFWDREKSREFRAALLIAAGRIGGEPAAELVLASLRGGKDGLQQAAAVALGDLRFASLDARVLKGMLGDGDLDLRRGALRYLALVPHEQGAALVLEAQALRAEDEETRALAALALGRQRGDGVLELLLERTGLRGDRATRPRCALAIALAGFDVPAAGARLEEMVQEADPAVAQTALWGLTRRGDVDLAALASPATRPRELAAFALDLLAWKDGPAARAVLDALVTDADASPDLREHARALAKILDLAPLDARARLRLRIQIALDDLGCSAEWRQIQAVHREMLRIEEIERSLDARPSTRVGPDGGVRVVGRWTREDEDLRLWLDTFPYFDERPSWDVPE